MRKNKFLLGMISLAVIMLTSCGSGLPDPDGLRIPNWGKSTTVAPFDSEFKATAMDAEGNIIAVGYQYKNDVFGYGDGVTAQGAGSTNNALIVKYEADTGKTLWARSVNPAPAESKFTAVATDRFGNIYAVGYQNKNGIYDYGNEITVTGASIGYNAVLVKYNSNGEAIWARSTTTAPSYSSFAGVAIDDDGNIYAVGNQTGNGSFDYGNGVTVTGASIGSNVVIVKYNNKGQAQWANSVVSASNSSRFFGVAVDNDSNIYAVGDQWKAGEFNYGNGVTATGSRDSSASPSNAVIVKYSSSGKAQWANSVTGADMPSQFLGVATDKYGNAYVVGEQYGQTGGNATFDYGNGVEVDSNFKGTSYPLSNSVIIKYSSSGQAQWGKSTVVATGPSIFNAVATTFAGDVYAVGNQQGASEFDWGDGQKLKGVCDGGPRTNFLVVSYDTHGKTKWAKVVKAPSSGSNWSSAYGITAGNNKLFVVGYQNQNGEFNYGNSAGDIKGAGTSGNAVITTFEH